MFCKIVVVTVYLRSLKNYTFNFLIQLFIIALPFKNQMLKLFIRKKLLMNTLIFFLEECVICRYT